MRTQLSLTILALVAGCGGGHAHHAHHGGMPHRFEDAEQWAARFEDPERDAWQKPDQVVGFLVDRPDLVIVDIGAATGYFPVRFARAAPQGQVIGVDIEPSMVDYLAKRAETEGLTNLESRLVAPDDPGVSAMSPRPDLVFICNTYHHIGDREAYFRGLADALKEVPGARLAIVDFRLDSPRGPPREHKIAPADVTAELGRAGWSPAGSLDTLPDQYVLVFDLSP